MIHVGINNRRHYVRILITASAYQNNTLEIDIYYILNEGM
jgi:hypothetical protein